MHILNIDLFKYYRNILICVHILTLYTVNWKQLKTIHNKSENHVQEKYRIGARDKRKFKYVDTYPIGL